MRKIPSPEINDKLIPILYFFADEQKGLRSPYQASTEQGHQSRPSRRLMLDWSAIPYKVWIQALKVRELVPENKTRRDSSRKE